MPKLRTSQRFKKAYQQLPSNIQAKTKKTLRLLAEDTRHPSLRTRPIQGARGVYEARVDINYRLTYERLDGDILLIRVVGLHDETLKNP